MPDRLAELRRQRALVQELLAWLEREIAATEPPAAKVAAPSPSPTAAATPHGAAKAASPAPADARVEDILAQYQSAPGRLKQDVRKGCLLYFALALLIFAAVVAGLYLVLGPR